MKSVTGMNQALGCAGGQRKSRKVLGSVSRLTGKRREGTIVSHAAKTRRRAGEVQEHVP